jgi:ring-1,2-phenylacetyl-CoA epoxidase subunit PaaE
MIHILSRERTDAPINGGRIDANKLSELNKLIDYKSTDEFFICGPEEMIFSVRDFLEVAIERSRIHFELFTTPGENQKSKTKSQGGRAS